MDLLLAFLLTLSVAVGLCVWTFVTMNRLERHTRSRWPAVALAVVGVVCLLGLAAPWFSLSFTKYQERAHQPAQVVPVSVICNGALEEVVRGPYYMTDEGLVHDADSDRCHRDSWVRIVEIGSVAFGTAVLVNLALPLLVRRRPYRLIGRPAPLPISR